MAEGGPGDSTPLAADDMIGSLATRVRELSLQVAKLEGELEAARRRVAVYEDFDAQVQDSLSAALRASNQIRERARVSAEAIAEEARAQRPATVAELDAMRIERDTLRRVIEGATASGAPRAATPAAAPFPLAEMRSAATEALRGVFKELVDEIRAATPPPAPAAAPIPASPPARADESPAAAPPSSTSAFIPAAPPEPAPSAQPPAPSQQPPAAPAPTPPAWSERTVTAPEPYAPPPSTYNASVSQPEAPERSMLRPTVVPQQQPAGVVEDEDVAPPSRAAAAAPAPEPESPPAAPVAEREQWAAAPSEPVGEVQVVLSPISSFPRLVELERRLQGMAVVRTVYARDFRNGVATLAIGLRHPQSIEEFAAAVTQLDYPRLRIISTSGYVLELRIDSEASSIA